MSRLAAKFLILAAMLLGLPLLGAMAAGLPAERFLEFPPATAYVRHAPFSRAVFALFGVFEAAVIAGIIFLARHRRPATMPKTPARPFPWWGWGALALGAAAWVLAWNRFSWFAPGQPHTFFPLWLAFALVANAVRYRRWGRSMVTDRPGFFAALFPVSAGFWWFFEYLNRFVQNWYYSGSRYGPLTYFLLATLSFSTVLPAVVSVRDLLMESRCLRTRFVGVYPFRPKRPKALAAATLVLAGAGLAGIGVWPDLLFPLLWVSPLLIMMGIQALAGESHVLTPAARGDWRPVMAAAAAALICGFFWEMWNFYSLARWTYSVPLVHRFQLFEMPILGYAGYLPFGLECTAVAALADTLIEPARSAPRLKS